MQNPSIFFAGLILLSLPAPRLLAYPPGVGILSKSENCLSCHVDNGPWKDDALTICDILDKETKLSLKQADGSFLIRVKRSEARTVLTVLGRVGNDQAAVPRRNGWLYLDPKTIPTSSLSKFAPGWEVNLPMSCRLLGDKLTNYPDARISVLPMTIRPTDAAQDAELTLQFMFTMGESMKNSPKEGMVGNYFVRKVQLQVIN